MFQITYFVFADGDEITEDSENIKIIEGDNSKCYISPSYKTSFLYWTVERILFNMLEYNESLLKNWINSGLFYFQQVGKDTARSIIILYTMKANFPVIDDSNFLVFFPDFITNIQKTSLFMWLVHQNSQVFETHGS